MKLVFCESCQDVIRLQDMSEPRYCKCGRSGGFYEADGLHAHYWGIYAMPLGFANPSLRLALDKQPTEGRGRDFSAFVIPHSCPTFKWHVTESEAWLSLTDSDGEVPESHEKVKAVV